MGTARLQQPQLTSTRDGLGASLDLKFGVDIAIVPFDRAQGEKEPLADLTVRESLAKQMEHF